MSLQVHLDELQGYATDPVKFLTPSCEPDQPLAPKLGAKTKNSLQLRYAADDYENFHGSRFLIQVEPGCGQRLPHPILPFGVRRGQGRGV